jgi:hypothetical protein
LSTRARPHLRRAGARPAGAEPGQAFRLWGTATQRLTVSAEGYGTVYSSPPGIACSTTCTAEFPRGLTVSLTDSALPGLEFKEWKWGSDSQGTAACTTTNGCGFTIDEDTRVSAVSAYENSAARPCPREGPGSRSCPAAS